MLTTSPAHHSFATFTATTSPRSMTTLEGKSGHWSWRVFSMCFAQASWRPCLTAGAFELASNCEIWCCTTFCHFCGVFKTLWRLSKGFGRMSMSEPPALLRKNHSRRHRSARADSRFSLPWSAWPKVATSATFKVVHSFFSSCEAWGSATSAVAATTLGSSDFFPSDAWTFTVSGSHWNLWLALIRSKTLPTSSSGCSSFSPPCGACSMYSVQLWLWNAMYIDKKDIVLCLCMFVFV